MPLGAHLPTSKGFLATLQETRTLGCDCLQIFTKSPRQWNAAPLNADMAAQFREAWYQSGFGPLVSHDTYLINLAAPDLEVRRKSLNAMVDEIERADALGCDYLVTHCGAHLQKTDPIVGTVTGLTQLTTSLQEVLARTPDAKVKIALENTAGQGTTLGGPWEDLATVLAQLPRERMAVCMDTCHAFAAGHDLKNDLDAELAAFEATIGLDMLAIIHLNDSKGELGQRLDRHAHIGEGLIGRDAMQRILTHPQLRDLPFILETPEIETHLLQNLNTVRALRGEPEVAAVS